MIPALGQQAMSIIAETALRSYRRQALNPENLPPERHDAEEPHSHPVRAFVPRRWKGRRIDGLDVHEGPGDAQ
jgi:hypothetical protein